MVALGVGIGVGIVTVILLIAVLIYFWLKYRKIGAERQSGKIMGHWWKGSTSIAIPPTSVSDVVGQHNKIGGITYGVTHTDHYENILPTGHEYSSTHRRTDNLSSTKISDQNLAFYKNEIPSRPYGDYIEIILTIWKGNYDLLEANHYYIQWLFPNRIPGVNQEASILTDKEAKIIRETPELKCRVKRAFEMMLDFYGMKLIHDNHIQLSEKHHERLKELNQWGNHNFLRISRILIALKELGHKDLMLPWMKFLADLIYQSKYLAKAESSFEHHWIETLDAEDKIELQQYLKNYKM